MDPIIINYHFTPLSYLSSATASEEPHTLDPIRTSTLAPLRYQESKPSEETDTTTLSRAAIPEEDKAWMLSSATIPVRTTSQYRKNVKIKVYA